MSKILLASTAVFLSAVLSSAQTPNAPREVSFDQVRAAARTTLRDSAEFPLRLTIETTFRDKSGKIISQKKGRTDYNFHGFNPRAGQANFDLRGSRGTFASAVNTFFAISMLGSVVWEDAEKVYAVQITDDAAQPDLVSARLSPPGCDPFKWSEKHQSVESYCGTSELHLHRRDLTLDRYEFEASGLPAPAIVKPFGNTTILKVHVSYDFQNITIPTDPKPYLLPQHMNTTIETDKGTLQISTIVSQRN
ncbi:MAG TPA: hypothetical protein VE783_04055 [Candidatus Limnocylindrales bacterium]|jgi:hypothetical protein|nr:hypothetical protein [Candidatus Limnocylindrales bacterium]